jgi:hypothetical protein
MRPTLVLALLCAAAAPAAAQQKPSQFMARYGWRSSLAEARAEASRSGKPIFLVFRCEP